MLVSDTNWCRTSNTSLIRDIDDMKIGVGDGDSEKRGDMKQRLSHGNRVHVMRCYMFKFMVIVCMDPSSMEVVFGWWVPQCVL